MEISNCSRVLETEQNWMGFMNASCVLAAAHHAQAIGGTETGIEFITKHTTVFNNVGV